VEVEDKEGNTALHIAARHGHASVVKTLVSNGANMLKRGAGGMLPVHMACLSGYSDCVENIIPRGHRLTSEVDSEDRTCLHAAACGGYDIRTHCTNLLRAFIVCNQPNKTPYCT